MKGRHLMSWNTFWTFPLLRPKPLRLALEVISLALWWLLRKNRGFLPPTPGLFNRSETSLANRAGDLQKFFTWDSTHLPNNTGVPLNNSRIFQASNLVSVYISSFLDSSEVGAAKQGEETEVLINTVLTKITTTQEPNIVTPC